MHPRCIANYKALSVRMAVATLIGLAALPIDRTDGSPEIPSKTSTAFDCRPSEKYGGSNCLLKPGKTFLEITLGMPAHLAFENLCREMPDAKWSIKIEKTQDFSQTKPSLSCDDWGEFSTSTYWMFGSNGFPCSYENGIVILTNKGLIERVDVICPHK